MSVIICDDCPILNVNIYEVHPVDILSGGVLPFPFLVTPLYPLRFFGLDSVFLAHHIGCGDLTCAGKKIDSE